MSVNIKGGIEGRGSKETFSTRAHNVGFVRPGRAELRGTFLFLLGRDYLI